MAKRPALPVIAWSGQVVAAGGVVFGADRLRPGAVSPDADGGAVYKFVPRRTTLRPINSLAESPLVAGEVFALQVLYNEAAEQFGQGCDVGPARWVRVRARTARGDAARQGATGFDEVGALRGNPAFSPPPDGRFATEVCWTVRGTPPVPSAAQVLCAADREPLDPGSRVVVDRFATGHLEFDAFEELAFNPVSAQLYVAEARANGDIFACLRDGDDRNSQTDGCLRALSVRDSSAHPAGLAFSRDGSALYVSIRGSSDELMPRLDRYRTDDVLRVTGFTPPAP